MDSRFNSQERLCQLQTRRPLRERRLAATSSCLGKASGVAAAKGQRYRSVPWPARQSGHRGAVPGQRRLDSNANGDLLFCNGLFRSASDHEILLGVVGSFGWELDSPGDAVQGNLFLSLTRPKHLQSRVGVSNTSEITVLTPGSLCEVTWTLLSGDVVREFIFYQRSYREQEFNLTER